MPAQPHLEAIERSAEQLMKLSFHPNASRTAELQKQYRETLHRLNCELASQQHPAPTTTRHRIMRLVAMTLAVVMTITSAYLLWLESGSDVLSWIEGRLAP